MQKHKFLLTLVFLATSWASFSQEIEKTLEPFNRIVVSPKINLVLRHGHKEEVKVVYNNVSEHDINIVVKGNTLKIYLEGSKVTEKLERMGRHHKKSVYVDAVVTAYVTYHTLQHLEIRGDQELTCLDTISSEKFKLKAYGENQIMLTAIQSEYFKAQLYGANDLKVKGGKVDFQKYKLYGENKIDTRALKSYATSATVYGESKVRLNSQDELRVNAFGEADISFLGNADVSKGWIFGKTQIRRLDY
jgi:hypothetical protein